jgi:1-phosphatidylinositol phosphodiesterase
MNLLIVAILLNLCIIKLVIACQPITCSGKTVDNSNCINFEFGMCTADMGCKLNNVCHPSCPKTYDCTPRTNCNSSSSTNCHLNALYNDCDKISCPFQYNWMSSIRDTIKLINLSIPGTHDSSTFAESDWQIGFKCQSLHISDQLAMGIRFLDIRVMIENDELYTCHTIRKYLKYKYVLSSIQTFLRNNPSEFVFVSVKHESGPSFTFDKSPFYSANENTIVKEARGNMILIDRIGVNYGIQWNNSVIFDEFHDVNVMEKTNRYSEFNQKHNSDGKFKFSFLSTMFTGLAPYWHARFNNQYAIVNVNNWRYSRFIIMDFPGFELILKIISKNFKSN